jgi:trehalose 6-phosphate synthase/phosphatase
MSRVLMVSNRLPISVSREGGELRVERSPGGLATGLGGVHARSGGLWIGWPGHAEELTSDEERILAERYAELAVVPVSLSREEVQRYYEDFCNGVLWPLLHYLLGPLPLEDIDFEIYERVNQRFADAVIAHHRPGDLVWVQDYQLMLVPQMIRSRVPDARIGYFLHIPFPSSDVFRTLPFRDRLLEGLLGADLIGFHTAAYMRHFASSALRTLGVATEVDTLRWDHRTVKLGVFPMGVDAPGLAEMADSPQVRRKVQAIRGHADSQILVGIDRLDYTKGIPRRLMAYERLLRDHPELRERVRLVQVAVPSRTNVEVYAEYRAQVDALIGRIHGQYATPSWVPVHYMFRALPPEDVVALYRAADAMLVTPIRDGMNLVAKEFPAARTDEDGVLVLSEFAGAASELAEALHVNPYDVERTADVFHRALTMGEDERRTRMQALRRRVFAYDVHRWARAFLEKLESAERIRRSRPGPSTRATLEEAEEKMRRAEHLVLLLDYDGTLVPFAATPDLARPDAELRALLASLARRPRTEVHVVSGRSRDNLVAWLGKLDVTLHGEHGLWSRAPGAEPHTLELPAPTWREPVVAILRDYADRTPGSLLEEKPVGLAWHYRATDPEFGLLQANELRLHLQELLSNTPVEILSGDRVIEVRAQGVHKGRVVPPIVTRAPGALLAAFGDDRTDEDLFGALPPGAISVHVGAGDSRAALRVGRVADVRALLRRLVV